MAQQSPWSVKGVRPECREAAKIAARRSDLTIGEWLNRAIMDAAKQSVQGVEIAPANHQLPAVPLGELTQAIEALSADIRQHNGPGMDRHQVDETIAPVVESVRQLQEEIESRFEALQQGDQAGPINGRVQEAEAKAERANLALAPLERKIIRLAQQMEQRDTDAALTAPRRGLLSRLFSG